MTLLTAGAAPDPDAYARSEAAHELARELVANYLLAYEAGEIKFEILLRSVHRVLSVEHVDEWQRHKTLGAVVERALQATPPAQAAGRRPRQRWLGRVAYRLVEIAHSQDGHGKGRTPASGRSAFEVVADICRHNGIEQLSTPAAVEEHRNDWLHSESRKTTGDPT